MSLLDRQTILSDKQAVTATAFSSDCYDTGNVSPSRNLGRLGLRAVITVDATVTAAGAATVNFEVGTADDAAGTNFTPFFSVGPVGKAALAVGAKPLDIPIPDTSQRYVMARYTVATGPLTAGTFTCALMRGSDFQRAYPDSYASAF